MRKYYQVALLIIASVSLVSLLFYRHEYNKLRYVLEVLSFFGKPGQKAIEPNCTEEIQTLQKLHFQFDVPIPSWQRLNDDLYVYSAHSVNNRDIRAVAFGKADIDPNLDCHLYFEGKTEPVSGHFSYLSMDSVAEDSENLGKPKYWGYHFICEYTWYKVPIGVSFFNKGQGNPNDAAILIVNDSPHSLRSNTSAICVAPPLVKPMSPTDMISFLNFHELIGIDNFIIYDYGIPSTFITALKDMAGNPSPFWKFGITTLPWNFPFTGVNANIIKDIVEADCLYRTFNKAMFSVTLSWEEYIVLKHHLLLETLLMDFDRTSSSPENRYKLETLIYCTQQQDEKGTNDKTPIVLRKAHTDRSIIENRPLHIYKPHSTLNADSIVTQEAVANLVTINRYQMCESTTPDHKIIYDPSILRFAGNMLNAPIFKKLITEKVLPSA